MPTFAACSNVSLDLPQRNFALAACHGRIIDFFMMFRVVPGHPIA